MTKEIWVVQYTETSKSSHRLEPYGFNTREEAEKWLTKEVNTRNSAMMPGFGNEYSENDFYIDSITILEKGKEDGK